MKQFLSDAVFPALVIVIMWFLFSVAASALRVDKLKVVDGHFVTYDNCDSRYPIDYILAARLFCPLPKEPK